MADELARLDARAGRDRPARRAGQDRGRAGTRRDASPRPRSSHRHGGRDAAGGTLEPSVAADLNAQLVLLTKRAALMESQVDVLEGKRRALGRYRDALADVSPRR